jgi:hypothetical protein
MNVGILIAAYEELIDPLEFFNSFESDQDFIEWLKIGNRQDIENLLPILEKCELYEKCAVVQKLLQTLFI